MLWVMRELKCASSFDSLPRPSIYWSLLYCHSYSSGVALEIVHAHHFVVFAWKWCTFFSFKCIITFRSLKVEHDVHAFYEWCETFFSFLRLEFSYCHCMYVRSIPTNSSFSHCVICFFLWFAGVMLGYTVLASETFSWNLSFFGQLLTVGSSIHLKVFCVAFPKVFVHFPSLELLNIGVFTSTFYINRALSYMYFTELLYFCVPIDGLRCSLNYKCFTLIFLK